MSHYPPFISLPTQADPATHALRLKMGQELQGQLEHHFWNKIWADVGQRFIKGLMGELDQSDEFSAIDWGTPRSRPEAEREADRMIVQQAKQAANWFGVAVADSLVVIGTRPPMVQMKCACDECSKTWTITLGEGKPLPIDAFECPDCIQPVPCVW